MSIRRSVMTVLFALAFVLSMSAATSSVAQACDPHPIGLC